MIEDLLLQINSLLFCLTAEHAEPLQVPLGLSAVDETAESLTGGNQLASPLLQSQEIADAV